MRKFNQYVLSFLFLFAFIFNVNAQKKEVEVEAIKITETVYMLTGQGGNIGLCVGEDGVFMIDDQYAVMSEKILAKVKELNDNPLKFVFNTHWHGDHTGGNENMAKEGAIIVAHKNVFKRKSTDQYIKAFKRKIKAAPKGALPTVTFEEDISFHFNNEDIIAKHIHNAHTDGDAFVYFVQSNVIHMGDTYFNARYPFIDISSGGNINGIIEAANAVLMIADDETTIIPGHGSLSNKAELIAYRAMLITMRDRVKTQIKAGKTLAEIQEMKLGKDYDEKYGKNFIKPERFIGFVYESLKPDVSDQ